MRNFKVRAAVAAAALALTGAASATIPANEVVFVAFNYTAGESFIFDTGLTYTQLSSTNTTLALGSATDNSAAWTTFLTDVGGSYDWMLQTGGDGTSIAGFTATTGATVPATVGFGPGTVDSNYFNNYTATAVSSGLATGAGGVILKSTTTPTNWGGDNIHDTTTNQNTFSNGDSPFVVTDTGLGTMNFYTFTAGTGRGATVNSALIDSITLTASGLTFSVGAVPEPGTYALMLAGLLAVGAVTRRRMRG